MTKILLAIDGSPCSEAAVEEVQRRLSMEDCEVRVVSAVEMRAPLISEVGLISGKHFEEVEAVEQKQARLVVAEASAKLLAARNGHRLEVTSAVLTGSPKRVIVEEAERWDADLIVVGSHGYRNWERMLLGSVSQAVALHAECSVQIVRHRKPFEMRARD